MQKYLKWSIIFIGLALPLAGCGQSAANQNQPSPMDEKRPKKLPPQFFASMNNQNQFHAGQQVKMHMITKSLRQNYNKLFTVSYDPAHNRINLVPVDKSVKQVIKYADKHNKTAIKSWKQFVKGVKETSTSVAKNSQDPKSELRIVHPKDTNKTLYVASNGKEVYDRY